MSTVPPRLRTEHHMAGHGVAASPVHSIWCLPQGRDYITDRLWFCRQGTISSINEQGRGMLLL